MNDIFLLWERKYQEKYSLHISCFFSFKLRNFCFCFRYFPWDFSFLFGLGTCLSFLLSCFLFAVFCFLLSPFFFFFSKKKKVNIFFSNIIVIPKALFTPPLLVAGSHFTLFGERSELNVGRSLCTVFFLLYLGCISVHTTKVLTALQNAGVFFFFSSFFRSRILYSFLYFLYFFF